MYGEITFPPIAEILLYLKDLTLIEPGKTFLDLGSGFGKPCIAAALSLPELFSRCVGIEYLDGLYAKSLELKAKYDTDHL